MELKTYNWTKNRTLIFEGLQKGMKPAEIVKAHGVSYSAITDVKNHIQKGDHPTTPAKKTTVTTKKVKSATIEAASEVKQSVEQATTEVKNTTSEVKSQAGEVKKEEETGEKKQELAVTPAGFIDSETEAKLVTVPVIMPITQIMQNWKSYLVKALHWSADTRWQDIIDTTIYRYALSLDPPVVLQGWYVADKQGASPKPASEKPKEKANSNMVDITSPQFKKLMTGIMVETVTAIQEGKLMEVDG